MAVGEMGKKLGGEWEERVKTLSMVIFFFLFKGDLNQVRQHFYIC